MQEKNIKTPQEATGAYFIKKRYQKVTKNKPPSRTFYEAVKLDDLVKSQKIPLPWWEGTKGRGITS